LPGAVYRSAQPSAADLLRLAQAYGVRTVINLRGFGDSQAWYLDECRGANRLNLALEDVGLSAGHLPGPAEVRRLVEVLDRSEYPVLFHCYRGVDRTGLACTIALLLRTDTTPAQARRCLGSRYLHPAWGRTGILARFFDLYEEWLRAGGRPHSRAAFRTWLERDYCPGCCRCRLELLGPVRAGPLAVPLPGAAVEMDRPPEAAPG